MDGRIARTFGTLGCWSNESPLAISLVILLLNSLCLVFQMWNLVENKELFQHTKDDKGEYSPQHHIAEMIALHGPPPQELLRLSEENSQTPWAEPGHDSRGTSYRTAREYFGGPYFDAEGRND